MQQNSSASCSSLAVLPFMQLNLPISYHIIKCNCFMIAAQLLIRCVGSVKFRPIRILQIKCISAFFRKKRTNSPSDANLPRKTTKIAIKWAFFRPEAAYISFLGEGALKQLLDIGLHIEGFVSRLEPFYDIPFAIDQKFRKVPLD